MAGPNLPVTSYPIEDYVDQIGAGSYDDPTYVDGIGWAGTTYDPTFPNIAAGIGQDDTSGSLGAYPVVDDEGNVPYELGEFPTVNGSDQVNFGITDWDSGFTLPITEAPVFHPTESYTLRPVMDDNAIVKYSDLDLEVGGQTGAVDRNAYVSGTMGRLDAESFRGDHAVIPPRGEPGSYGDAGNAEDPAIAYAQGLAANAYPTLTAEDSQNAMSLGY